METPIVISLLSMLPSADAVTAPPVIREPIIVAQRAALISLRFM